ncbi:MAG: glycoside hydrolase family 2 TIM barrel-domain containing protein [Saprospiraceae bacterium]
MKVLFLNLALLFFTTSLFSQGQQVTVVNNSDGNKLTVDGKDFMVNGMNWDYFPIGTNFNYSLWSQPDDIIKSALDSEMSLLKNMGVNTIRVYTGIQPKWITYIYEKYGIHTMLNHSFGRYGLTLNGAWVAVTDYRNPETQQLLLSEVTEMARTYQNTPGLLFFLLGNENNYGLFWAGAETEDFPDDDKEKAFIGESRGRPMYKLMNDAALKMKAVNPANPVAICNGDVLFIDIIAEECKDVDIYGTNTYRGVSFGDMFEVVREKLNKPVVFTEFGADAFNAIENAEDQFSQAFYMVGNWKEIYQNAAGLGKADNSIGGFTFQFSDGWWKYGQTKNLEVHDNNASWSNGGYFRDHVEGENNMNEEWFGIAAKGETNARGLYQLYPRAAYYALKEAHQLNPYTDGVTSESVENYFSNIQLMDAVIKARGDKAALIGEKAKKLRLSQLQANLTTYNTGGSLIETPVAADPTAQNYPDELGFDHMQSYFIGVEAKPSESVRANVSFNVLGNVAENPIDEIFYENRGQVRTVNTDQGGLALGDRNRIAVYNADFAWNHKYFDLKGFYRTGHYHWGYEGDFFGLYPEANYGPNIDIYNGNAPFGFEINGKKELKDFKVAFGPELWWGANPAVLVKYSKKIGHLDVTGIFHEDIDNAPQTVSSFAIPQPRTRRATLHLKRDYGKLKLEAGGIWGGQPLVGRTFQVPMQDEGVDKIFQDEIQMKDTWGGKAKMMFSSGPINWYAQGAAMGLVAFGGADYTRTFTGWRLKDSGSGNQYNFLTGFTYLMGDFQIAPNFLWQKPVVDPIPINAAAPGRPRNILDDPFSVRSNRETIAGELLLTYDPTPGTWMYEWDNDMMEDAPLAASVGFVYRHHPTIQDAAVGILGDGRTIFAFPGSAPAQDLWEVNARIVSKMTPEFGFIANMYGGNAQARGSDPRLLHRFGADLRMIKKSVKLAMNVKVDDWGPFDYHRDFNLTYPLQLMADLSTSVGNATWFDLPNTRLGMRYTWRALDEFSPRYCPTTTIDAIGDVVCDPEAIGFDLGQEWEIRTYLQISIK